MQYKLVDYLKKLGNLFLEEHSKHYYFSKLENPLEMLVIEGCFSLDNHNKTIRKNTKIILDPSPASRTYYYHKNSKKTSAPSSPQTPQT